MTVLIGLLGAAIGGTVGVVATFVATRANLLLGLQHEYDRALREKRLEHYEALFRISGGITRNWRLVPDPTRADLLRIRQELSDWYYGPGAPGMFLTPAAKRVYIGLVEAIEEAVEEEDPADPPTTIAKGGDALTLDESSRLRHLVSELRHQLAEDVGASHPPRLSWTRPPGR